MASACQACGGATEWEQSVGSCVCIQCGVLADPTQSVLDSHAEPEDAGRNCHFQPTGPIPLKSLRNGGWDLAGQGKEGRDRRNTLTMHEFIRSVTVRLGHPGMATRSIGIFDLVMKKGQYRWGRRARLTAGAAIAIALRESHKADSLRDIGLFLEESVASLARAFMSAITLMGHSVASADPSVHIPALLTHFSALVKPAPGASPPTQLPEKLLKPLSALHAHLSSIQRTAVLLCSLFARLSTLQHVPTPPTACAIVVLALEAEARAPLPCAKELAAALGARLGSAGTTVQSRYKIIYDIVEDWIRDVPWLEAHQVRVVPATGVGPRPGARKIPNAGKRVVVARGMKDTVQFQEEIWRKKVDAARRPKLVLEEDAEDEDEADAEGALASESAAGAAKRRAEDDAEAEARVVAMYPWKKRKMTLQPVDHASAFLLSPLSTTTVLPPSTLEAPAVWDAPSDIPLMSHLLAVDDCALSLRRPPTRLQMLTVRRGGGDDAVADEELFDLGELEGFLRTTEEVRTFSRTVDWSDSDDDDDDSCLTDGKGRGRFRAKKKVKIAPQKRVSGPKGTQRVNMNALAKLLGEAVTELDDGLAKVNGKDLLGWGDWDPTEVADDLGLEKDDYSLGLEKDFLDIGLEKGGIDDGKGEVEGLGASQYAGDVMNDQDTRDGEAVEEWRPLSPDAGGLDDGDWYEF